jgi:hypothetical protein
MGVMSVEKIAFFPAIVGADAIRPYQVRKYNFQPILFSNKNGSALQPSPV